MSGCGVAALVAGGLALCGFGGCAIVGILIASRSAGEPSSTGPTSTDTTAAAPTPPPPAYVSIEVVGALVAPTKLGGAPWDDYDFFANGQEQIPTDLTHTLIGLIHIASPYEKIVETMFSYVGRHAAAPDPFGYICVPGTGLTDCWKRLDLEKQQDVYEAVWDPPRKFVDVPLETARLRVHLDDADPGPHNEDETQFENYDSIATVIISNDDIRKALALVKVYHCPVADQSSQLLYVNFAVTEQ